MLVSAPPPEVVKWYTRARRFPQLIGRTPDGTRLPGGPYTFTQVIGASVFVVVAFNTIDIWGRFDLIGNFVVLAAMTAAVLFGLGRVPLGARNPLSVVDGAVRALTSPRTGRVAGRPVRNRKPRRVRGVTVVQRTVVAPVRLAVALTTNVSAEAATASPARTGASDAVPVAPHPAPVPAARPVPPQLTGVQKLLAGGPTRPTRKAA